MKSRHADVSVVIAVHLTVLKVPKKCMDERREFYMPSGAKGNGKQISVSITVCLVKA